VIHQGGYGYADIDGRKPVTPHTVFGLASLTKTFTALTLLWLVDRGMVRLDDTLDVYLGHLPPQWQKLTIRQLASMQAGMRKGIPRERPWPEEMKALEKMPLLFPPGSASEYSNPSYRILGNVIEKVTGKPYLQVVREVILDPLGMSTTGTTSELQATGLVSTPYDNQQGKAPLRVIGYKDLALSFAAGMLASTSADLALYVRALMNRSILSPVGYETLWIRRPPLPNGNPCNWAFGWGSTHRPLYGGQLSIGMNGGDPAVASTIIILPESQLAVIALSNLQSKPLYRLPRRVLSTVLSTLGYAEAAAQPEPSAALEPDELYGTR